MGLPSSPVLPARRIFLGHGAGELLEPFPGDDFEGIGRQIRSAGLLSLSVLAGVHAISQELSGCISSIPGLLQTHIGIHPQ